MNKTMSKKEIDKKLNKFIDEIEAQPESEITQAEFDKLSVQYIQDSIPYSFTKELLVKPLPIKKVKVIEEEPIPTDKRDKETGAMIYKGTKKVEKEVEPPFVEGIIIGLPTTNIDGSKLIYELGQHILYSKRSAISLLLYKDAVLVRPYDVVATVKDNFVTSIEKDKSISERIKEGNLKNKE